MDTAQNSEQLIADCKAVKDKIIAKYNTFDRSYAFIKDKFDVPFVHSSMALKGNRISINTIKSVTKEGFAIDGVDFSEAHDILAIQDAYLRSFDIAKFVEVSVDDLKALHKILEAHNDNPLAGQFKIRNQKLAMIKTDEFLKWFNDNDMEDTEFVATAYQRFIYIHPFKGSNGIMARLVANIACLRRKFTPFVIPYDTKETYDELIKKCDKGITQEFIDFVRKCIADSLKIIKISEKETYSEHKNRYVPGLDVSKDLLDLIRENPGIKIMEIKNLFKKVSFAKVQRTIHDLRMQNLVEFRGLYRTGGYYLKDSADKEN